METFGSSGRETPISTFGPSAFGFAGAGTGAGAGAGFGAGATVIAWTGRAGARPLCAAMARWRAASRASAWTLSRATRAARAFSDFARAFSAAAAVSAAIAAAPTSRRRLFSAATSSASSWDRGE